MTDKTKTKTKTKNKAKDQASDKIFTMIVNRTAHYKASLRHLIILWLLGILALIFLVVTICFVEIQPATSWYLAANLNGTVIKSSNIRTPIIDGKEVKDQDIINWVVQAVPRIYNYDFLSNQNNFRNMIELFTPEGFREYKYALDYESKILDTVAADKLSIVGFSCGNDQVKILGKGVAPVQGFPVYVWRVQMPMVAQVANKEKAYFQKGTLEVSLMRAPKTVASNGWLIWKFIYYDVEADRTATTFNQACQKQGQA